MNLKSFAFHVATAVALLGITCECAAITDKAASGRLLAGGTGYASVVRLSHQTDTSANGRLLLVFEQSGTDGVPLYESRDDGDHWQFVDKVTDQAHHGDAAWQLRWQPHITEIARASGSLKVGTLLLAANATGDDAQGRLIREDLQLYASTDEGKSWHYRSSIVQGGGHPSEQDNHGVWEPNIHILDDGRMVAYYSSEQHKTEGYNQLLAHKVSSDGGQSWGMEYVDVAIGGGVERPGMAVVARLPSGDYVMTYEDIDGPDNGKVYMKFSHDALVWGDPQDRGTPVQTEAGAWPAASPTVQFLPIDGANGVLVVLAERAGGGGDVGGRSMYWNNDSGRGPWWEAPAPVQKLTGNIHAGWTQALLLKMSGELLQITSSSSVADPTNPDGNEMLYASTRPDFTRYEAEDAARRWTVQIDDPTASNRRKARMAAGSKGQLAFTVHVAAARVRTVLLRWKPLAFPTRPRLALDGRQMGASTDRADRNGWHIDSFSMPLAVGDHTLTLSGATHAMDVDYLQLNTQ